MLTKRKPLIVLTGPTAVGKTALSIALAKAVNGEIISADSIQVYKGLDIGSAKITREEMDGVSHHLIDVLDPREDFNVVAFQRMAKEAMAGIYSRGHIPVIVGGTGFYIQAVLKDIDFTETCEDPAYRRELEALAAASGPALLHEMLSQVDPESAENIHANNVKRVIRALEYYRQTNEPISAHNAREREKEPPYNSAYFVLNDDRALLYQRIDRRVDEMMKLGLVQEVAALRSLGIPRSSTAMQGLGYKEIYDYLEGDISLEEAVYRIKRDTRHFAKRQITWFKREPEVIWVDRQRLSGDEQTLLTFMLTIVKERNMIHE